MQSTPLPFLKTWLSNSVDRTWLIHSGRCARSLYSLSRFRRQVVGYMKVRLGLRVCVHLRYMMHLNSHSIEARLAPRRFTCLLQQTRLTLATRSGSSMQRSAGFFAGLESTKLTAPSSNGGVLQPTRRCWRVSNRRQQTNLTRQALTFQQRLEDTVKVVARLSFLTPEAGMQSPRAAF